ncbi:MAG: hypothetical protein ACOCYR_08720 [Erythrobacter sp.]
MINIKEFRRALKAAIEGPEVKKVSWGGRHEFNVKKVRISKTADGLLIDGEDGRHISRHRTWRPDDQVYYTCKVRKDGTVADLRISIKSSEDILKEWFETAGKIAALVLVILQSTQKAKEDGVNDPLEQAEPTSTSLELLDGDWEGDAEMLIANIIAYAVANEMPEVAEGRIPQRGPRPSDAMPNPVIPYADLTRFRNFRDSRPSA